MSFSSFATTIEHIERVGDDPGTLLALLDEQSDLYAGRSTNEVERLRGFIFSRFGQVPDVALPIVVEELRYGRNPYTVAAAAHAINGDEQLPKDFVEILTAALNRMGAYDDRVSLAGPYPDKLIDPLTTPTCELKALLARISTEDSAVQKADEAICCSCPNALRGDADLTSTPHNRLEQQLDNRRTRAPVPPRLTQLSVEDQSGEMLKLEDVLLGKPCALAFFYTRCMNPEKCSLTITKLAGLQSRVLRHGLAGRVRILGITYDPEFDNSLRLHRYGHDRGMRFDSDCRLCRTTGSFAPLQSWLDLGVSYGPTTVNQHRLEFVILDSSGRESIRYVRTTWDEDGVCDNLRAILNADA